MDNYNYPIGADTTDAPWNQVEHPEKEVEVTISVTLSKTTKVRVNDYKMGEDGYDFSDCNLKRVVEDQIPLPQDNFVDWNLDEMEVICDN